MAGKGKAILTTSSPAEYEEDEKEDDSSKLLRRSITQTAPMSSSDEIQEVREEGKSSSSEIEEIVEEDGEESRKKEMKRHSGEGSSEERMRSDPTEIEPLVTIREDGVTSIVLKQKSGWSAEVSLYGGHVTSWKDSHGEEMLFVSSRKAVSNSPKAVFGGIPICFPQFSNFGRLERHGFARKRYWSIDKHPPPVPPNSHAFVDLILQPSGEDANIWPNSFEFRLRVRLSRKGQLRLTSRIKNTNVKREPFSFTFAYHTYFFVSDISDVRVEGLETLDYRDSLRGFQRFTEEGALTFESEVDRAYMKTPCHIKIHDHKKKRTFLLDKDEGLPDAVVRNPWDKKVEDLADFGPFDKNDYKNMLCVGAAYVDRPITLKPGEKWTGRQKLSAFPSNQRVVQG